VSSQEGIPMSVFRRGTSCALSTSQLLQRSLTARKTSTFSRLPVVPVTSAHPYPQATFGDLQLGGASVFDHKVDRSARSLGRGLRFGSGR
jgi:hypothetical protein